MAFNYVVNNTTYQYHHSVNLLYMNYHMKIKALSYLTNIKLSPIVTVTVTILVTVISLLFKHIFYNNGSELNLSWLQPSFNHGISYSIAINIGIVILVSLICLLWIVRMYIRWQLNSLIFILIMSWWLSNFIDRVIYGGVRDWIYLWHYIPILNFVFNIADVLLILGWILLLYHYNQIDITKDDFVTDDKLV